MKRLTLAFSCVVFTCMAFVTKNEMPVRNAEVQAQEVSVPGCETPVRIGGYGSSMAYRESDSCFFLLTDRGPNVEGTTPESKIFPLPDFVPHIGKFRLQAGKLVPVERIELKEADGTPFSGIPNAKGDSVINETAYTLKGEIVGKNGRRGIDPEGLALAPDGSFWVSDEYAPCLFHFDPRGFLIEEFSPFNGILPQLYASRRPNRGMEGLTISNNGKTLTGIMQSPLYFPSEETKDKSLFCRIISISLPDKKVKEYLYQLDSPLLAVSEIISIDDNEFLVLERDGLFPHAGKGFKKIFRININGASNIAGDLRPFETMTSGELDQNKIRPVQKELFLDILKTIPAYPHDKPEGIALTDSGKTLCIVNDDDFGINAPSQPNGSIIAKLTADGSLDRNMIYFVKIRP